MVNDLLDLTLKDMLNSKTKNINLKYKFIKFYQNEF